MILKWFTVFLGCKGNSATGGMQRHSKSERSVIYDTGFSSITFSSDMDIFVLSANKMCKYDQIIIFLSLKFSVLLSWFCFAQKVIKMWHLLFLYIRVFGPSYILQSSTEYFQSKYIYNKVYILHILIFIWSENVKIMKKIRQNIQIGMKKLYRFLSINGFSFFFIKFFWRT